MSNITKVDLQEALIHYGFSQTEAKIFVNHFFEILTETFVQHQGVRLPGFGVFDVLHKKKRIGRNLHSGKDVVIPPRATVSFRASAIFKDKLNEK